MRCLTLKINPRISIGYQEEILYYLCVVMWLENDNTDFLKRYGVFMELFFSAEDRYLKNISRQNEFNVMSGRKKAVRRIFLFENLILFTKPKRTTQGGDVYQYKNSWLVSTFKIMFCPVFVWKWPFSIQKRLFSKTLISDKQTTI